MVLFDYAIPIAGRRSKIAKAKKKEFQQVVAVRECAKTKAKLILIIDIFIELYTILKQQHLQVNCGGNTKSLYDDLYYFLKIALP